MRASIVIALNASLLLTAAGCRNRGQSAAAGALPPVPTTVGPIPGGIGGPNGMKNPYAGNEVAMQEGRRLFNWYNCSGCHGGHAGGGMGPSLRDRTWIYGDTDAQIFDSIAEGRSKGMPAWGAKIPEDQIWQLVAYIKSMRTPQEPSPPVEPPDEQVPNPDNNTPLGIGPQVGDLPK